MRYERWLVLLFYFLLPHLVCRQSYSGNCIQREPKNKNCKTDWTTINAELNAWCIILNTRLLPLIQNRLAFK